MLILLKDENGKEKAVNLSNLEFEAETSQSDVSKIEFSVLKNNEVIIQTTISEESYENIKSTLSRENMLMIL